MFEQMETAIQGSLRIWLLTMEWVIFFLCLEISFIFLLKLAKKEKPLRNQQERAFVWLFLGFAIIWIFLVIGDYYAETEYWRLVWLNIGTLLRQITLFFFFFRMEKDSILRKTYFFTKVCLFTIIIDCLVFYFFIEISGFTLYILYWLLLIPFFILYLYRIRRNKQVQKVPHEFTKIIIPTTIGFALIFVGHAMSRNYYLTPLGLYLRVIGDLLQIGGLIVLMLFLTSVPSLNEFSWSRKIEQLYVILKSGTSIYYRSFKGEAHEIDQQSSSDSINSINSMFQDLSNKESLSIIEKKGKIFMIQPGNFVYGVLICSEELISLKILLNRFIERIEDLYRGIFKNWEAGMKIFEPLDSITKEIFY